jgi:hypothetical protein
MLNAKSGFCVTRLIRDLTFVEYLDEIVEENYSGFILVFLSSSIRHFYYIYIKLMKQEKF